MTTYPDAAYQPVMDFYNGLPEDKKRVAGEILNSFKKRYKEGEAPPEEMLSSLKAIVAKESGLEAKVNSPEPKKSGIASFFEGFGRMLSNPLVATAAAAAFLMYGLPPLY